MILLALLLLIYILERDLGLFLVSFIIIIQYMWMFLSMISIESGAYIDEQKRYGYFVFGSLVLILFFISTLLSLAVFKKVFLGTFNTVAVTRFKFYGLQEKHLALIVISLLYLLAFINLLSSPIPLLDSGVTKFSFWDSSTFPFLEKIIGNTMSFVVFGAALLYKYYKKISIGFIVLFFIYMLLVGQKFTGFLIGLYGILVALYFSADVRPKFKFKWIYNKYTLIFLVSMFGLVLYRYSLKNPYEYLGLSPIEAIFQRTFGLQAHVFWGVTEQYVYLNKPNTWDIRELWTGMHHIMWEFWPWSKEAFYSVTERGVSWTNAYPSILLRIFPWPLALIANFILFSFVALIQTILIVFIKKRSLLISIVLFQLLTWVSYAYTMAYFYKILIPVVVIFTFFLYKFVLYKMATSNST